MNVEFYTKAPEGTSRVEVGTLDRYEIVMTFENKSEGYDYTTSFHKVDAIKLKDALDCLIKTMEL